MITLPQFIEDILIATGPVAAELGGATSRGALWQAAPGRFLLDVPDIARYLVENGRSITIEPAAAADPAVIERILRMTPFAALLYQRGILAMHAAAVTNGTCAVVLAGDSGAGKSALLAALLQRGWTMLTDELAPVTLDPLGNPIVHPSFTDIALWPETLEELHLSEDYLPAFDSNRRLLTFPEQFSATPCLVRKIFRLGVHSKNEIETTELYGTARFQSLGTLAYNSRIADALLDRVAYMRLASVLAQSVSVSQLLRPRGQWTVRALVDLVERAVA